MPESNSHMFRQSVKQNVMVNCPVRHSTTFHCPNNRNCTIKCTGQQACLSVHVNCPNAGYQCNIICSDPFSCNSLTIGGGGFQIGYDQLQCCGDLSCVGVSTDPTTNKCYYREE